MKLHKLDCAHGRTIDVWIRVVKIYMVKLISFALLN